MADPLRVAAQALLTVLDGPSATYVVDMHPEIAALRAALAAADPCGADLGEYGRCELPAGHEGMHAGAPPAYVDELAPAPTAEQWDRLAAADGTTPAQPDEVLWEGETLHIWAASNLPDQSRVPNLPVPPGTRVRVVATPATENP